jgi:hypothetical protein
MPSLIKLIFGSSRNQRGNCSPILATVRLYSILQLGVFAFCPFTRTFSPLADARIQGIIPSAPTLIFRSTWNHICSASGPRTLNRSFKSNQLYSESHKHIYNKNYFILTVVQIQIRPWHRCICIQVGPGDAASSRIPILLHLEQFISFSVSIELGRR